MYAVITLAPLLPLSPASHHQGYDTRVPPFVHLYYCHCYFLPALGRDTCVFSLVCLHWYFLGPQVYDTHFPLLCIIVSIIIISWLLHAIHDAHSLSLYVVSLLFP